MKSIIERRGFTFIELVVCLCIIMVLIALIIPAFSQGTKVPFQGTVTQKWTDIDGDGDTLYRIQVDVGDGEGHVYNSWLIHDKVFIGQKYSFQPGIFGLTLKEN